MPELTLAQRQTLKAHILADPVLSTKVSGPGTDYAFIADALNANASPDFWSYRTNISTGEIGRTVSYVAIAAMTTANLDRVNNFINLNTVAFNGRDDIKTFLNDTFSGALGGQGQATRDALDLMLRRKATRAEKLFCTGTGSTASPGAFVWEGSITLTDIPYILLS